MWFAAIVFCMLISTPTAALQLYGNYPGYRYAAMPPQEIPLDIVDCVLHFSVVPRADGTLDVAKFGLQPARMQEFVALAPCAFLVVGGGGASAGFRTARQRRSRPIS